MARSASDLTDWSLQSTPISHSNYGVHPPELIRPQAEPETRASDPRMQEWGHGQGETGRKERPGCATSQVPTGAL